MDRNNKDLFRAKIVEKSPSTRRAWIEIRPQARAEPTQKVALHTEGVDRNTRVVPVDFSQDVALHTEGVDRNRKEINDLIQQQKSPSTRRAWIEISGTVYHLEGYGSPSTRRAWIEIENG